MARASGEISIADVIRALDGELANVRGSRPEDLDYVGAAAALQEVWIALRASERAILEGVTLAHVVSGEAAEGRRGPGGQPVGLGLIPPVTTREEK